MERSNITDDGFFVFQDFLLQFSAADGIADCDETVHAAADKIPDSLEIFLLAVAERYKIGAVSSQFQLVQQPDDHCLNVFFQGDPVHSEQDSDGPCLVSPEELVPEILLVTEFAGKSEYTLAGFFGTEIICLSVQYLRNRGLRESRPFRYDFTSNFCLTNFSYEIFVSVFNYKRKTLFCQEAIPKKIEKKRQKKTGTVSPYRPCRSGYLT